MAHVHSQSYGKSRVRLSRIIRDGSRHSFIELTAAIALEGDFTASYTANDNRLVVATDTMKNTVYVLAHREGVSSIEGFAQRLAGHFLTSYSHVTKVTVTIEEKPWTRMTIAGREHDHSFVAGGSERSICELAASTSQTQMRSGFRGLQVLKTTASAFSNFHRDEYATLKETDDRIFATTIEASWPCGDSSTDWTAARAAIRLAILKVFAENFSASVQATLYQMAVAAFNACPRIDEIAITMPNQHHLLANLEAFGMTNTNVTFVPTDEPHGLISAVIRRDETETP
jgi:urate oxidase